MKIIELLNKIANGEEVPNKIKYAGIIWKYDNATKDYISDDMFLIYKMNSFALNKSFEILEEDKKIEKLDTLNLSLIDANKVEQVYDVTKKEIILDIQTIQHWINKTIDAINSIIEKSIKELEED